MSKNMQAIAAQASLAAEARQLERTWRSWTRSVIPAAKKRRAERNGVAVTVTSDGLMAKPTQPLSLGIVRRGIQAGSLWTVRSDS